MSYRPISEYAVIGNDDRCALVDRRGSIDWCSFPHVASPSVFGRLVDDERGGHFTIQPTASYESESGYIDRTNVLRTTFTTDSGVATLTDFMPIVEGDDADITQQSIVRQVRCGEGRLTLEADFTPRLDYARGPTDVQREEEHLVATNGDDRLILQIRGPMDMTVHRGRATGTATIEAGTSLWYVCQFDHLDPWSAGDCRELKQATVEYWQSWSSELIETAEEIAGDDPWLDPLVRSGLVLKLLINEGSGAIYAAATTSLPEEYGGDRNWDYRYNWIRDAKFTVQALFNLGKDDEAHRYFEWFNTIASEDPEELQPAYGVHGEHDLTEYTLDHLRGYRHSQPVRVGNAAAEQRQLDIYGAIVQGMYETIVHDGDVDDETWGNLCRIVDYVCEIWDEPDDGIWEYRSEPRHYVHSKLMCWVALDRGYRLARSLDRSAAVDRWRRCRETVREGIETDGYSESRECFTQFYGTDDTIDATCLLIPIYEFLPPTDARVQSTIDTVCEVLLTDEGLVHRVIGPDVPDEGRGTFLFCSFWLVDALTIAGQRDAARAIFTNVLEHVDSPYLLAERIDPATGEYLGNFPQAFSHIGLINSAIYLGGSERPPELEHDPGIEPIFRA